MSEITPAYAGPTPNAGCAYERHRPEQTVLWKTLQEHWKTFLAEIESVADPPALPAFVVSEVEAFLRCGILGYGFGRRMCDFAARLVTNVLPRVPIRQWVLTVLHGLRVKLGVDPALTTVVLRQFIGAVSAWLRRQARRLGICGALKTGAVTVIQRFNSALELAPHFHTLFMDGVWSFPAGRKPLFHPVPAPSDDDVAQVAAAVFRRVERKLAERKPAAEQERFVEGAPLLVALAEASARGVVATGPRRGSRVVRVRGVAAEVDAFVMGRLCAQVEDYNLQAATRIAANDRDGLERMGRYLARPPIATERLARLEDGRLELRLKRPWRDGTTALRFSPEELLERLVGIVPRPRAHLVRYSGVLAPAFAARSQIVPSVSNEIPPPDRPSAPPGAEAPKRPGRFPWASLIWRVFLEDVLACARCSGRMAILAAVTSKAGVTRILEHLGLPTDAPAFHPALPPPQAELPLDAVPAFEADPPARDDFGV